MEPLISVIVPVFNGEKYIGDCLGSILCQSYRNLEILVVDDGSTDRTVPHCERLKALDGRIVIHPISHGGVSVARNHGLSVAKGDYITFVDSDDCIASDLIARLYKAVMEADAQVGFCRYVRTSGQLAQAFADKPTPPHSPAPYTADDGHFVLSGAESILKELILGEKFESHVWGKLYKRTLFDGITFPRDTIYEDMFTTYQVLAQAVKGVFVDYPGYCYVNRKDSLTGGSYTNADLAYPESAKAVVLFCEKNYPALMDVAIFAYYRALFRTCKKYWKSRRFQKESTTYFRNALKAYESRTKCLNRKDKLALCYVKARIGFLDMVT